MACKGSLLLVEFVSYWTCFVTRVLLIGISANLEPLTFLILVLKFVYNKGASCRSS